MMWKERYKVGIKLVDTQHKQLFDTSEKLIHILESEDAQAKKQECKKVIIFLKDYAVNHFAEEEGYMLSTNYSDIERHKILHKVFINTVHALEKKLIDSDFPIETIKEVVGFLTTWFIYHIAKVDQQLGKAEKIADDKAETKSSYLDCFAQSVKNVLDMMVGISADNISYDPYPASKDDIFVKIGLIGDYHGDAVFTFSKKITLGLIKAMTSIDLSEIDELAYSALREITNIISGNASALISASGKVSDIKPPEIITDYEGVSDKNAFYFDTQLGCLAISVNVCQ